MRIWDLPVESLCRQHLLGEHRELHAIWAVLTQGRRGYARHPETLRWRGKLAALYRRHEQQVEEMRQRGYQHLSPLKKRSATGSGRQRKLLQSADVQRFILHARCAACRERGSK